MFVITCFLVFNILFYKGFCEEVTTVESERNSSVTPLNINNISSLLFNNETDGKDSVKIERAVLPVSQTQQILTTTEFQNSTKATKQQTADLKQFRPSPQLETYYEYNKIPVTPAIGEAKFSGKTQGGEGFRSETSSWELPSQTTPGRGTSWTVNPPWVQNNQHTSEQGRPWNAGDPTSESPWLNRVKFPSAGERPYSFVTNQPNAVTGPGNSNNYLPPSPSAENNAKKYIFSAGNENRYIPPVRGNNNDYLPPNEGNNRNNYFHSNGIPSNQEEPFAFNKPVEVPTRTPSKPYDYPNERRPSWEKYGGDKEISYSSRPKGNYDYNLLEKPASSYEKTYDSGHYGISDASYGVSPIKKILKLLATFIPIGLLISALTPTVITVTNVNDTTDMTDPMRYRSEDPKKVLAQHVISSLGYFDKLNEQGCEYRVFCELLISASNMKDSEQHVENLLSNFSDKETNLKEKADELKMVFEAVRRQDCSPIRCKYLKGPS